MYKFHDIYADDVRWSGPDESQEADAADSPGKTTGGYTLTSAMLIVRQLETQPGRNAVFSEIRAKNAIIRLVDMAYQMAGKLGLQPFLLFAYMLKCVVSTGPRPQAGTEVLGVVNFANEKHSVERILQLLPDVRSAVLSHDRRHMFSPGQVSAAFQLVMALPGFWSILRHLARTCSFMPACRVASVLAYYARFQKLVASNPSVSAVLTASNYSPEAVAIAAAAHKHGRKVIYTNHAPVPANSPFVPPVLADFAVFYGDAIRETYEKRSRCNSEVILVGQPGNARPMQWKEQVGSIGIFLTALTELDVLETLIRNIKSQNPEMKILVRHHPVSLLKTDLSRILAEYPDIKVTQGTPLEDDIQQCDLVFCGNSGVTMNILRAGRPVAYLNQLDTLPHDYLGIVADGLVCEIGGWRGNLYGELRSFYSRSRWERAMVRQDASYGGCSPDLLENAATQLNNLITKHN